MSRHKIANNQQNYVATKPNYAVTESKKTTGKYVVTGNYKLRQELDDKDKNHVMTELSLSRQSDHFGLEILGFTICALKCGPSFKAL